MEAAAWLRTQLWPRRGRLGQRAERCRFPPAGRRAQCSGSRNRSLTPVLSAVLLATIFVVAPPLMLQTLEGKPAAPAVSSVIMFWRADCGPCRLELSDLKALRSAAAPLRVRLVGLQSAAALREGLRASGLPAEESLVASGDPAQVLTAWGGAPPRLPLAVAVDAHGNVCGRHTGLVGSDRMAMWSRSCTRGGERAGD